MLTKVKGSIWDAQDNNLGVNVKDFGVVGDGVTDDSASFQAALNALTSNGTLNLAVAVINLNSTTVNFPSGVTDVTITGGEIRDGILKIDGLGDETASNSIIEGVIFSYSTAADGTATGNDGLNIVGVRNFRINNCTFKECDKAIELIADASAAFHETGTIFVTNCFFLNVNYAFYQDQDPSIAVSTFTCNDCHFTGNLINTCWVNHIYCKNIDGMVISNNTMFMSGNTTTQTHHIHFANISDQIIIQSNNLFESGYESILLNDIKRVSITNNNIVWAGTGRSGSAGVYSAISITGAQLTNAIISQNNLTLFSKHAVEINGSSAISIAVGGNLVSSGVNPVYDGTENLSTYVHHTISQANNLGALSFFDNTTNIGYDLDVVNSPYTGDIKFGMRAQLEVEAISVTAPNTPLCDLRSYGYGANTYSALLYIEARSSTSSSSNTASYIVHLSKNALGGAATIINSEGLTTGAAASFPSFTFSVDTTNNHLEATPVGSTSGTFFFYITSIGDLLLGNL